jgi:hypothetical protein
MLLTPDEDMKGIFGKLKKEGELDNKLFTFEEGGIVDLEPNMEDEMMDREMMDRSAQELASKGRYGDSMLVHMAPEEVAGIASLGGVSMNPETGLPEMFKMRDFMKFAAPIALSVALPGAGAALGSGALSGTAAGTFLSGAVGQAALAGLGSGLGSLMTGSNRDEALQSGLTAGLTYGLASKAGQAMQGGEKTLPGADVTKQVQQGASDAATKGALDQVNVAPKVDPKQQFGAGSTQFGDYFGGQMARQPASIASGPFSTANATSGEYGNLMKQAADNQGFYTQSGDATMFKPDLSTPPKPSMYSRAIEGLGGYGKVVPGVLAGGAGAMAARPIEEEERRRKEIEMAKPWSQPATYPGAGYGSREYSYFGPNYGLYAKEGGHIKQMQEGGAVETTTGADIPVSAFGGDLMSYAPAITGGVNYGIGAMPTAMGGYDYRSFVPADYQSPVGISSLGSGREQVIGDPNALQTIQKDIAREEAEKDIYLTLLGGKKIKVPPGMLKRRHGNAGRLKEGGLIGMQEGGITSLPQTEGQVDGNGDGMSDEVYGDIENQQEVALSKDEFIVPADVVSGLGNGSSNAGASKLYEMMARVRKARTGKESQPEEIEAEEFMPA